MKITEEVDRRRITIRVEDPEKVYSSFKTLLEEKIGFSSVNEEKYYNDVEGKDLRVKLTASMDMDHLTSGKMKIYLHVDREASEADIQLKTSLVTEYPTDKDYQESLLYYAYRSLYDKFLYGSTRGGYRGEAEEKTDTLVNYIRQDLEAEPSG